ncbi:MOS1T transposase, partial [Pseudoatta argentina]
MSIFVPNKVYLRGILLHYFIQKKSAAEAHRILVQTYGDNALSDTTCRDWFRRFKNNDFQLEDKERSGAPTKFQDKELEQYPEARTLGAVLIEAENYCFNFASHRIVTGDEKWIHYDNPKRRKSWGKPGHASTSSAKPNNAQASCCKTSKNLHSSFRFSPILADRRFHSYEEAQKWIDSWIASKDMSFFRWEKVVSSDGQYFK